MTQRRHEAPAEILDRVIDTLLAGAEWRDAIPADHPDRAELLQLGETAERLVAATPQHQPVDRARWTRILRRIAALQDEGSDESAAERQSGS